MGLELGMRNDKLDFEDVLQSCIREYIKMYCTIPWLEKNDFEKKYLKNLSDFFIFFFKFVFLFQGFTKFLKLIRSVCSIT